MSLEYRVEVFPILDRVEPQDHPLERVLEMTKGLRGGVPRSLGEGRHRPRD
jgi:hypothetical protein